MIYCRSYKIKIYYNTLKMRVFVAIDLPESLKEKIFSIYPYVKGVRGKFVEKENLHITLKFLGEIQPNIVNKVKEALSQIEFEQFKVRVKGLGLFGNRVLWIGISTGFDNIVKLHEIIDKKLSELGFEEDFRFHPHITILRIKNILNRRDFEHFLEEFKNYEFGEFYVTEFKLKQSILRPEGPLYLDIKSFKLK